MRKEFTMNEDQRNEILNASKPTPVMYLSGGKPMFSTPQENANHAWKLLGERMGFDYFTVRPVEGKSDYTFSAETVTMEKEPEVMEKKGTQIAEFSKTEAALATLREKFAVIPDCSTKEGYEECRVGIRELVSLRTSLDKARLKLNADDQARIKFRNDEAKRITKELVKLEEPMKDAKGVVDAAEEAAKEEVRRLEEMRISSITFAMNAITACGNVDPTMEAGTIQGMLDKAVAVNADYDFEEFAEAAEAERKRVLMHIEKVLSDRLDFEEQQQEQTRIAMEQAEAQRKIDDANRKIEEQQAAIDKQKREIEEAEEAKRQAEMKKIADAERAEAERLKAIADAEQAAADKEREEQERIEWLAKQEALRPDKDKVIDWAAKLRFIDAPDGIKDERCKAIVAAAIISLNVVAQHVITKTEAL